MSVVVYRNLMLRLETANIGVKSHLVKIIAVFIHHDRTEEAYRHFFYPLKEDCPAMEQVQAYRSDGDPTLIAALKVSFSKCYHMLCELHFRDNLKEQFRKFGVDEYLQVLSWRIFWVRALN